MDIEVRSAELDYICDVFEQRNSHLAKEVLEQALGNSDFYEDKNSEYQRCLQKAVSVFNNSMKSDNISWAAFVSAFLFLRQNSGNPEIYDAFCNKLEEK